jgi:hypothetical protein
MGNHLVKKAEDRNRELRETERKYRAKLRHHAQVGDANPLVQSLGRLLVAAGVR